MNARRNGYGKKVPTVTEQFQNDMFGHVVVCDPPVWKLEMALEINDEYALRHYTANYGLSAIVRDMWYWGPCCVALVETHEKPSRKIIEYAVDLTDTEVVAT